MLKLKKWATIEKSLALGALFSFLAACSLLFWFYETSPRLSRAASGGLYSFNFHAIRLGLTNQQVFVLDLLFYGSAVLFVAAVAVDRLMRPFKKSDQ